MKGIEASSLENIANQSNILSSSIEDIGVNLRKKFNPIEDAIEGDLLFLVDDLGVEIYQTEAINNNNIEYGMILEEIVKSYQAQDTRTQSEISSITTQE